MRDIDSTETELEQVENENNAEITSLAVGSSPSTMRKRLLIILSLLSLYFIWGGTYLAMRIALHGFPPFILAGVRQLTAGIILFLFLRLRKHESPTRKQWLTAIIVGGLLLVVGNGGVVFAEQWVSSGLAALALGAIPLWAALFSGLFGRWPTRIEWFGLGLGFSGLVLLNLENGLHANPLGAIVLLIAPMSWALGSILSQHLPSPKGLMASASQMLAGGVMLFIVGFATGEHMTSIPGPRPLAAMAYLIIGGSLVAFSAYGYLLRHGFSHVKPEVCNIPIFDHIIFPFQTLQPLLRGGNK